MTESFDDGFEFHKLKPDLTLNEVWWAWWRKVERSTKDEALAFVEGYQAARKQREEAEAERTASDGCA